MNKISYKNQNGLWLYIYHLKHPDKNNPDVKLIPMVHLAEPGFFKTMDLHLYTCDSALYEGAFLNTRGVLRRAYRILAGGKKIDLAVQGDTAARSKRSNRNSEVSETVVEYDGGPKTHTYSDRPFSCCPKHLKFSRNVRYIRADLGPKGTQDAIASIPKWFWFLSAGFLLFAATLGRFLFKKNDLAKNIFPSKRRAEQGLVAEVEELELPNFLEKHAITFARYVTDARDAYLFKSLKRELFKLKSANHLVGVQYGAAHMQKLMDRLVAELGYKIVDSEYVLAIAATDDGEKEILDEQYDHALNAYHARMSDLYFRVYPESEEGCGSEIVEQMITNRTKRPLYDPSCHAARELPQFNKNFRCEEGEYGSISTQICTKLAKPHPAAFT